MSLMLVALLVCSLFSMGASAESISPVSDEAAYAKYFPEGVPDYLNDEQIQQVLNGQYLSVVVNDEIITYNPVILKTIRPMLLVKQEQAKLFGMKI